MNDEFIEEYYTASIGEERKQREQERQRVEYITTRGHKVWMEWNCPPIWSHEVNWDNEKQVHWRELFLEDIREDYENWVKEQEEEKNRKPRKQFAFTFTTNQSKEEIQAEMCYSCYKLFLQQTVPIRQGEAYLEYTKEGRPHIHGWYETEDGGRVFAKVFQRAWKYWKEQRGQKAFAGGFHELMKSNRYKGYASAEGRVIIIKKINEELVYNAPGEEQTNAQASSEECDIGP